MDRTETRIGIRRIGIDGDRFVINGERMFLRGVNRHQEYPYVGYALSPQADYRDAKLIKEAGFDYVRLSHYPHSPAFMAAADELGLVLLNSILGWQFINPDPRLPSAGAEDVPRHDPPRPQPSQRDRVGMLAQRERDAQGAGAGLPPRGSRGISRRPGLVGGLAE